MTSGRNIVLLIRLSLHLPAVRRSTLGLGSSWRCTQKSHSCFLNHKVLSSGVTPTELAKSVHLISVMWPTSSQDLGGGTKSNLFGEAPIEAIALHDLSSAALLPR